MLAKRTCRHVAWTSINNCPPTAENIWITDAHLSRAWRSFSNSLQQPQQCACRRNIAPKAHAKLCICQKGQHLGSNGSGHPAVTYRCSQARGGSFMPGPLEARRRATKRRMMGLSAAPELQVGGEPYVPALFDMYGFVDPRPRQPKLLWQPPTSLPDELATPRTDSLGPHQIDNSESASKPAYRWLPSWMLDAANKADEPPTTIEIEQPKIDAATGHLSELEICEDQKSSWQAKLRTCYSVHDIQIAATSLGIPLGNSTISRMAFHRLMDLNLDDPVYLAFLSDRDVNFPQAFNTTWFLRAKYWQYKRRHIRDEQNTKLARRLERIEAWLGHEVSQGSMTEPELRNLLQSSQMRFRNEIVVGKRTPQWAFQSVVCVIWEAIKSSKVRSIGDLEESTIRALAGAVTGLQDAEEASSLAAEILVELHNSTGTHSPELFSRCLTELTDCLVLKPGLDVPVRFYEGELVGKERRIVKLLMKLPPNLMPKITRQIFMDLLHRKTIRPADSVSHDYGMDTAHLLEEEDSKHQSLLADILFSPESPKLMALLRSDPPTRSYLEQLETKIPGTHPRLNAAYLCSMPDARNGAIFLLNNCLLPQIRSLATPGQTQESLQAEAIKLIKSTTSIKTSPYAALLDCIDLPNTKASNRLACSIFLIARYLPDGQAANAIVEHLCKRHLISTQLVTSVINSLSHTDAKRAMRMFYADTRIRLEWCPNLAVALIRDERIHDNVLFTLLNRSMVFEGVPLSARSRKGFNQKPLSSDLSAFLFFLGNRMALEHRSLSTNRLVKTSLRIARLIPPSSYSNQDVLNTFHNKYAHLIHQDGIDPISFLARCVISRKISGRLTLPPPIKRRLLDHVKAEHGSENAAKLTILMYRWQTRMIELGNLQNGDRRY